MSRTKINRKTPGISSDEINLQTPRSWAELSQKQLRYVLWLLTQDNYTLIEMETLLFIRLADITVIRRTDKGWLCSHDARVFFLDTWQALSFARRFSFIERAEECANRIDAIGQLHAADIDLQGVTFRDYLIVENLYQSYLAGDKTDTDALNSICRVLYYDSSGDNNTPTNFGQVERLGTFLWYTYVKSLFAKTFSHLLSPSDGVTVSDWNPAKATNAQIRALTDGDITKEDAVLSQDCWRALTELDEKARESAELEQKLK